MPRLEHCFPLFNHGRTSHLVEFLDLFWQRGDDRIVASSNQLKVPLGRSRTHIQNARATRSFIWLPLARLRCTRYEFDELYSVRAISRTGSSAPGPPRYNLGGVLAE